MNGSAFCEIKYMNGIFLYMIQIRVDLTKITNKLLPHTHIPPKDI